MKVDFESKFGAKLFDDKVMKERLSANAYESMRKVRDEAMIWDPSIADEVANTMRTWAMEQGATHFVHWCSPLTGTNSGRHDSFLDGVDKEGKPIINFSGKMLSRGESDASSFPSGGLRSTFEARGYTVWDTTSPCFVIGTTLYIPTVLAAFTGESLDMKAPLIRTTQALNKQALRLFHAMGYEDIKSVKPTMGAEQEYFLVERETFDKRLDLKLTGRTIFGRMPSKGQELGEHYYGSTQERVREFMRDIDNQLWELGIPAKTEHNEVAPGQFELACVYREANVSVDNNRVVMDVMRKTALRHGLVCLLHEKPFTGINGSGKHDNYSLVTDAGENLLKPGDEPEKNIKFLITLAAFIKGVDEHADMLRLAATTEGNDFRLGAHEAPPAIVSMYLGANLQHVLDRIAGDHVEDDEERQFMLGAKSLPAFTVDENDRNRTSPFAFTGFKFEFRMAGSSQHLGFINTVINALVTVAFRDFAKEIENCEGDPIAKAYEIVGREYKAHKRVLFNGNGYAPEWIEEAQRRGLPNLDCTVKSIPTFIKPENIAFLERSKAMTETEAYARYDAMFTRYVQKINIELNVAAEMVDREILPAAIDYLAAVTVNNDVTDGKIKASVAMQETVTELVNDIYDLCSDMKQAHKAAMDLDTTEDQANALYLVSKDKLSALRRKVDTLEITMPKDKWPMPTYTDLLFDL